MFARLLPVARSLQVIHHARCDFRYAQAASFAKMYGSNKSKNTVKKGEEKFSMAAAVESILINEKIRYPSMRVVFTNEETGETEWKIMSRGDALFEASNRKLDLVLVNDKSDPVVCKIESFKGKVQQMKALDKEIKQKEKDRRQKETYMTGGIEPRDFQIKMNKVDSFLKKGHTVKVTIVPKRFTKNNRFKDGVRRDRMGGFDETILMLLEHLEKVAVTVSEQKVKAPPPPTTMMVKGKKVAVPSVAAKAKKIAPAKGIEPASTDADDADDADGSDDEADEPPPLYDDESESDDDENSGYAMGADGNLLGVHGQRLILRREFLLTPKAEMIAKEKKK